MPRRLLTLALILTAPAVALADPEPVTFRTQPLREGEVWTRRSATASSQTLTVSLAGAEPREETQAQARSELVVITVAELQDGAPQRLRIEVKEAAASMKGTSGTRDEPDPLVGEVVLVTCRGEDEPVVESAGEAMFRDDQKRSARRRAKAALEALENPYAAVLPKRPLTPGEGFEVPEERALPLLDLDTRGPAFKRMAMTLRAVEGEGSAALGIFDLEVELAGSSGGVKIEMTFKGELRLGIEDSRPRSMRLSGPVTLDGKLGGGATLKGEGTSTLELSAQYREPASSGD